MPNEPIQCPNCGSSDVRYLAAESYECEHCETDFRWVDPTKKTVVHKPDVCKCGRVAAAYCVRCGEPVCKEHGGSTNHTSKLSADQIDFSLLGDRNWSTSPYKECMEKHRIPQDQEAILCTKCAGECVRAIEAMDEAIEEKSRPAAARTAKEESPPPAVPLRKMPPPQLSLLEKLCHGLGK